MTDLNLMITQQPTRYLFRTPIPTDFLFNNGPYSHLGAAQTLLASAHRQTVSYLRSIASQSLIKFHLPTNRRFSRSDTISDLRLVVPHFHQGINLVSLFWGKLSSGSHKYSFDLAVREVLILSQLTSLSTFKVALGS